MGSAAATDTRHDIRRATRGEKAWGVFLSTLCGAAVAVQSRINGELGVRLDDGVLAALISFTTGLVLLLVVVALVPGARAGTARLASALRTGALRPWQCLGGFSGALLVTTQSLTVGEIGVAIFAVAIVAGQTGSSLLVDRAGLGPAGRQPLTWPRIAGSVLTLLAVVGAMSGRIEAGGALWLVLLPLIAGSGIAVQQAVNAQVRAASHSTLTATLVNFVTGTALLTAAWLVARTFQAPARPLPGEPWLYLGGTIGVLFIAIAVVVVRWIGLLLFSLATIAGQLIGAVTLDLLVPAPGVELQAVTVIGTALTLVAIGIAALPGGRIGRPDPARPVSR